MKITAFIDISHYLFLCYNLAVYINKNIIVPLSSELLLSAI